MAKPLEYYSHAEWTKISQTTDTHQSEIEAYQIAYMLYQRYNQDREECDIRGHCKRAWVTNEQGKILKDYTRHAEARLRVQGIQVKEI